MKTQPGRKAALYMRLSRDDGAGESASIATQRSMLRAYAVQNGYDVYDEYIDDGWSGTNFDRPAFARLLRDIECNKIGIVITKDLSRLGRDYIGTGQYTEIYFPSKGVRYIAINDGYDSQSACTDIAPFQNVVNELYARDASKKIRSAFIARMREGEFIGAFAPYGYCKDPADKHHLIVDEAAGEVVKELFALAGAGESPVRIARRLNERKVPSPAVYRSMHRPELQERTVWREWTGATVAKMLRNVVYLGHTAQGKTTKVSFKSGMVRQNPREQWFFVRNTHEALVDEELFQLVRRRMAARTCEKKGAFYNAFSGIAKCADCGHNMSATGTRKKGATANLTCGNYKLHGKSACSNHFIDYDTLVKIVRESLREQLTLTREERLRILTEAEKKTKDKKSKQDNSAALSRLTKRMHELDAIIGRLYEDHAQGRLSQNRMQMLLQKYQLESESLEKKIDHLKKEKTSVQGELCLREKANAMLEQITDAVVLTPDLLFRFIDRIEIHQGYYEKTEHGKVKHQIIKIWYRFETQARAKEYRI